MAKFSIFKEDVVDTDTGKKARGKFKVKEGKTKTSIYKLTKKGEKFIGFARKMKEDVKKKAEKLYNIRVKKQQNRNLKNLRQLNRTFMQEEYERNLIQRKNQVKIEDITQIEQNKPLSKSSIKDIEDAIYSGGMYVKEPTSGQVEKILLSREQQALFNFRRMIDMWDKNQVFDLNKINFQLEQFGYLRRFDNIEDFKNWLKEEYENGGNEVGKRSMLWDLLHSLEPESGYTYSAVQP